MPEAHGLLKALLDNLRKLRQKAGLSDGTLERRLILGPGWIGRFERGETVPSIDMVLAILREIGAGLPDLLGGLPAPEAAAVERRIFAEQAGNHISVYFDYAKHNAQYALPNSTLEEFGTVIKSLRDGLAELAGTDAKQSRAIKSSAVARAFLDAVHTWPHANPSDLWGFVISRAYCDPYNHPAQFARLNLDQSWKRTSGWALEAILVSHYGSFLKKRGVNLSIAPASAKQKIVDSLDLSDRIEPDKIDVVLSGDTPGGPRFFGIVHVKASLAERRTDDVPLSTVLIRKGYTSSLWTMDCKSMPGTHPINRGELGTVHGERSAKRKDIEDEGYFSGCFSYNQNTMASSDNLPAERRVYVCDFSNPHDTFSRFILQRWKTFRWS